MIVMMIMTMVGSLIMVVVMIVAVAVVMAALTLVRVFSMLLKFLAYHRSHFVFIWTLIIDYFVIVVTRLPVFVLMLM